MILSPIKAVPASVRDAKVLLSSYVRDMDASATDEERYTVALDRVIAKAPRFAEAKRPTRRIEIAPWLWAKEVYEAELERLAQIRTALDQLASEVAA